MSGCTSQTHDTRAVVVVALPLRVRADDGRQAWERLEHEVAPAAMAVDGVCDLRLPRSRELPAPHAGMVDCLVQLTMCAGDPAHGVLCAQTDVRRAITASNCAIVLGDAELLGTCAGLHRAAHAHDYAHAHAHAHA